MEVENKKKIIAILLNIICLGSGYFYVGLLKKSFVVIPLILLYTLFFYYISTVIEIGYLSILFYITIILLYIYIIYDTTVIIDNNKVIQSKYNSLVGVISFVIFNYILLVVYTLYSPIKKYNIPAASMSPTIIINDQIITNSDTNISRGDLVVFYYPFDPSKVFIKRCIAKGGDILFLKDKNLFIKFNQSDSYIKNNFPKDTILEYKNQLWVRNPYRSKYKGIHNDNNITDNGTYPKALFNMDAIEIPENSIFVMGDNRDHSNDSRFWGVVPNEYIKGKAKSIFINYSNLNRSGTFIQ